jgi:hypothetical protein
MRPRSPVHRLIIVFAVLLLAGIPRSARSVVPLQESVPERVGGFTYVSPSPGTALVSPWNTLAFRQGCTIDATSLDEASLSVVGSASGTHDGRLVLSDDGRTIVFRPDLPFALGEDVAVTLDHGIRTRTGTELPGLSFHFTVSPMDPRQALDPALRAAFSDDPPEQPPQPGTAEIVAQSAPLPGCAPPSSYPPIALRASDHPEPGYVFFSPFRNTLPGHLVIVDNLGNPIFYRRIPAPSTDFKVQPDGRLTYFSQSLSGSTAQFYALDASYTVVDSFATGNGYVTDSHELQVLPNGHALLMSYDPEPVRMDTVVAGGKANAVVIGLIVQEIDSNKNVVFQWRSWDHFKITDSTSPLSGLTSLNVDYVHGNAIAEDLDGNLLLSSRHLCEITKINRETGDILWRMGPHASRNQFTFLNDPRGFSCQHDVRRLPNGHITVFDNGNFLSPTYSRAVEYQVDEVARTATLVWVYQTPPTYGSFMGDVQRHESGGTMIGWGGTDLPPGLTELHADGTKAFELGLAGGTWTYRAFRFPWRSNRFTADPSALDFQNVAIGDSASLAVTVRNPAATDLSIDCAFSTDPAFEVIASLPGSLSPGATMQVEVRFRPIAQARYSGKLYLRSTGATELIAQDVDLSGQGVTDRPPDVRLAHATPSTLWPPNHDLVPIAIDGVTDPDGDPVAITIESITQDEDPKGSDAATCPEAMVEGDKVWVRAERSGNGGGRVYRIGFTARDPLGLGSSGTLRVCVPHDQGGNERGCEDDGQIVDSLAPCGDSGPPGEDAAVRAALSLRTLSVDGRSVAIELTRAGEGAVTLAVYDLAGRRVASLGCGPWQAGSQRLIWNTGGVASGLYFLRARAGSAVITRPVIVAH